MCRSTPGGPRAGFTLPPHRLGAAQQVDCTAGAMVTRIKANWASQELIGGPRA